MKIRQFSQQGKRSNNEDCLGTNECLLTVCDGMGGHNYGERASAFVKDAMLQAFSKVYSFGKVEIQQALNKVQTDLNKLLDADPELEKMGTTFTGVFRTPDVWYAAHIGDSRIYLIRPSERKLWHTWDHSLVGELMRTHEITVEAGRFHPMSNRISRAVVAHKDGKPASASVVKIDELKAGDILLLCSDGVVEAWGDWDLARLFSDKALGFEQKCKRLAEQCDERSRDNNTAIITEIEAADAFSFGTNDELEWTTFDEVEADYRQYLKDNGEDVPVEDLDNGSDVRKEENDSADIPDVAVERKSKACCVVVWLIIVAVAIALPFIFKNTRTDTDSFLQDTTQKLETESVVGNDNVIDTSALSEAETSRIIKSSLLNGLDDSIVLMR